MKKNVLLTLLMAVCACFTYAQTNLIVNGDFSAWEADGSLLASDWTKAENCTQNSTDFHSAPYSCEHTGGTKDISQIITVEGGVTYTISFWYKTKTVGDDTDSRIWCSWKSDESTSLEDDKAVLQGPDNAYLPTVTEWTEHTVTLVAPETATLLNYELRTYKNAVTLWDDLSVVEQGGTTPVDTVVTPEEPALEITGFTPLTDVTIAADSHVLTFGQVEALLADSIELTVENGTLMAEITAWTEGAVAFDGTAVATYTATPVVVIPADYTDTTATDFTAAQSIILSVVQTVDVPATVASLDISFDTKTLEDCKVLAVSGEKSWYLDVYEGAEFFTAYAKINTYGAGANEAWLITPPVNMDAITNPTFTFDVASYNADKTIADCGAEQFEVYYTTTPNYGEIVMSEWTRFTSVDALTLGAKWDFVTATVDVSAIAGDNVAFAFRHKSSDSNGTTWEVDNIVVKEGTSTSIVDLETISTVFGSKGLINIATEGVQSVTVYDFSGRVCATQTIENNAAISISAGAYIVKVGNQVTKVAVQ